MPGSPSPQLTPWRSAGTRGRAAKPDLGGWRPPPGLRPAPSRAAGESPALPRGWDAAPDGRGTGGGRLLPAWHRERRGREGMGREGRGLRRSPCSRGESLGSGGTAGRPLSGRHRTAAGPPLPDLPLRPPPVVPGCVWGGGGGARPAVPIPPLPVGQRGRLRVSGWGGGAVTCQDARGPVAGCWEEVPAASRPSPSPSPVPWRVRTQAAATRLKCHGRYMRGAAFALTFP